MSTRPGYLAELSEETMLLAWGEDTSFEDHRKIVLAATIFGRQFDERVSEHCSGSGEAELRRFLMGLMNDVVEEFARREGLDGDEAAEFLGEGLFTETRRTRIRRSSDSDPV